MSRYLKDMLHKLVRILICDDRRKSHYQRDPVDKKPFPPILPQSWLQLLLLNVNKVLLMKFGSAKLFGLKQKENESLRAYITMGLSKGMLRI